METLVSLIVPCYNSEKYVGRLLDSIFQQTYPIIEVIAVDDGSIDATVEILRTYIPRFEQRGYSMTVVSQTHGGQSKAIDTALKLIHGSYFAWPDSDDFYSSPDSIKKMVNLVSHTDETVGAVRCLPQYVDENGVRLLDKEKQLGNYDRECLFYDGLWENNGFQYLSGGYIVKTASFDRCVKDRNIAVALNAGQNWQLLLPIFYNYRCVTIYERLHTVVVRASSHSRGQYATYDSCRSKLVDFHVVLVSTIRSIDGMPDYEKNRLITEIGKRYDMCLLDNAFRFREKSDVKKYMEKLKTSGGRLPIKKIIKYLLSMLPGGFNMIKALSHNP